VRVLQHASAILFAANHAERAEQTRGMVEARIWQFREIDEIRFHERAAWGIGSGHREHFFRQIDADAIMAELREVPTQSPGAAAEIDKPARLREVAFAESHIHRRECRRGHHVVVARDHLFCVQVVPQPAIHAGR
jgi:predicted protein tyrosine phosphatase